MIAVDHHDGVAVVRLEHGKVNVLDLELLRELSQTLAEPPRRRRDRAHGRGPAFSAGVDLKRLLDGSADDMEEFLLALDEGLLALYDFPRPAVAAVNGHAIAGGCILVEACDYRIMSGGTIGVAELKVGVPFPTAPFEILRDAVGPRTAALVLTGRTVGPEEALAIGLVDATVGAEHLLDRSLIELACWREFRGRRSPTPASSCAATRDGASKRGGEADRPPGRSGNRTRSATPSVATSPSSQRDERPRDARLRRHRRGSRRSRPARDDLVAFDTTARSTGDPPRQEADLQRYLGDRLGARGATVDIWEPQPSDVAGSRQVDDALEFAGRPQLAATLWLAPAAAVPAAERPIDVVTPDPVDRWASDPWRAEIRDGNLYGRGTCDMKGGIGSMVFAAETLARLGKR